MGLGLFTDLKLSIAMLVGAVGMLLSGVLNMDEAYGAINWKTIFTLACLIPLGGAMDSTGAAAWIAQEVLRYLGEWPQWGLQAVIAILALLFSQVVSNVGATVMMVPMAINVALASGGNPAVYALLVAISTSNTFVIAERESGDPIIAGPGGYRSRDFLRVGLPLTRADAGDDADRVESCVWALSARLAFDVALRRFATTDSRPCVVRPPSMAAGYFLLLAQKKVTKENGTLGSAPSPSARVRCGRTGSAHRPSMACCPNRRDPSRRPRAVHAADPFALRRGSEGTQELPSP